VRDLSGPATTAPGTLRTEQSLSRRRPSVARSVVALAGLDAATPLALFALIQPFTSGGTVIVTLGPVPLLAAVPLLARVSSSDRRLATTLRSLAAQATAGVWFLWLTETLLGRRADPLSLAAFWLGLPFLWRANRLVISLVAAPRAERIVVVGSGEIARRVIELYARHRPSDAVLVGVVDDPPAVDPDLPVLGSADRLPELIGRGEVDRVVVAQAHRDDADLVRLIRDESPADVGVDVVPRLFDLLGPEPRAHSLGGVPVLSAEPAEQSPAAAALKRLFDIVTSVLVLAVASPVFLAVACTVLALDGRPIFFRQRRIGRYGKPFEIVKFRTMAQDAELHGTARMAAEADANGTGPDGDLPTMVAALKHQIDRQTRIGTILRRTSLDELPQLYNVLVGEMSLVGPRPLRAFEIAQLEGWERERLAVRPGITGLWQVNGRSEVGWNERMSLDYSYVRHWSLENDLRILAQTPLAVLRGTGAR
jgi:exopolysaccharide biosynthesis polyprenyl glycosylphosphotransferase